MLPVRKHHLNERQKRIAGVTLVETMLVIGISGVIIASIWYAAGMVNNNNKLQASVDQLETMAHNIHSIYAEQGGVVDTGGGALTKALDQMRAFPLDMRPNSALATGVIYHLWSNQAGGAGIGGSVGVDADNCSGVAATGSIQPCFGVTFYGLPQTTCVSLIGLTSNMGSGLMEVMINGANAGSATAGPPLPIPASTAAIDCGNGNGNTADVTWIFSAKGGGS